MSPERWERIKEIFGAALELPDGERPSFLQDACAADPAVRQEVERLLEAEHGTLESPLSALARLAPVELAGGEMLAHYRVESKVGQGGMGTVYRAYDTRLDRQVALKILPAEPFSDPGRKQRLFREARAASGLMHPNIVTIHDIGSDQDIDFIAMEYVEGRPLGQAIPSGGLAMKQALAYAVQIAGALSAAHAAGIVHRDLKPSNIMVTREGLVKLLDFGVAHSSRARAEEGALTVEGVVVGTPSYMSPEQVRGNTVDHRSDIFSFGEVLYEMVAGRRAFSGGSPIETMNAILNAEPAPLSEGGRVVPFAVDSIIRRCLEKEPEDRFQSARDLGYALEASAGPTLALPAAPRTRRLPRNAGWIAALVASFGLALLVAHLWDLAHWTPVSLDGRVFARLTDEAGAELFPSLSPDGKALVYAGKASGNWDIYLRRVGNDESTDLTKDSPADDTQPAFSPDGKQIAFRSDRDGGGVFLMRADGSGLRRLTDAGYNPAWSPDGREILYAEEGIARPEDRTGSVSRLWAVAVASGRRRLVRKDDAVQPQWSPGGQRIAFWAIDLDGHRDIWTIPAGGGQPVRVTIRGEYLNWNPVWSPSGAYLYFCSNRGGNTGIWRIAMKETSGEPRGAPEPIRTPAPYTAHLSFSRDGRRLAYVHQATTGRLWTVRFDPATERVLSEPREIFESANGASRPALSPDGKWLAFNTTEQQEDLYVIGPDGTGLRQLTSDRYLDRGPRWSPDGKRIAFFSTRSGDSEIWTVAPDGSGLRQMTALAGQNVAWPVWSNDGKYLAYTIFGVNTFVVDAGRPWAAPAARKLPAFPEPGQLFNGWSWSPDGRLLAGFLNRGDGIAVYSLASGTYRKLTDIGADPVWLSDSKRLLFHHRGRLHLVDSESGRVHEVLAIAPDEIARRGFALSADDRHVYFSVSSTEADVWMIQFEGRE